MEMLMFFLITFVILVFFVAYEWYEYKKKLLSIKMKYGMKNIESNQQYNFESIAAYYNDYKTKNNNKYEIDDLTWNDLDFNEIFVLLDHTYSTVGKEILYKTLRTPSYSQLELENLEKYITLFSTDEKLRFKFQKIFSKIGIYNYNKIGDYTYRIEDKKYYRRWYYDLLSRGFLLSLIFLLIEPNITFGLILLLPSINSYYNSKINKIIDFENDTYMYMLNVINAGKRIQRINDDRLSSFNNRLKSNTKRLSKVINLSGLMVLKGDDIIVAFFSLYKMITLYNYRSYNKILKILKKDNKALISLIEDVGRLEVAYAIASYRASTKDWCVPTYQEDQSISYDGIYHPLVEDAVENDLKIDKNILLTGSNASGKSTFMKALAINGILGQSIHTVHAQSYNSKLAYHLTSMAVKDNISAKDSYFMAEIKSVKRIMNLVDDGIFFICYIDEILKGTNTIERVAASTSILKFLEQKNCITIVATHDLELTRLLDRGYINFHFKEEVINNNVEFSYKLLKGPATSRNAIKLLEVYDYNDEVLEEANALAFKMTTEYEKIKL